MLRTTNPIPRELSLPRLSLGVLASRQSSLPLITAPGIFRTRFAEWVNQGPVLGNVLKHTIRKSGVFSIGVLVLIS